MALQPSLRHLGGLSAGTPVTVRGRLVALIDGGFRLRDHSGSVELAVDEDAPLGAWVQADGLWDGHTVQVEAWQIVQTPVGDFPALGGDWARLQDRDGLGIQRLAKRAQAMREVRSFFDARGFCELETPLAVPSPGLDLHLDAFPLHKTNSPRWLITSPEYQMKRALSAGLPRIYQLCHCFRRDESGVHHDPEFTMLEWYRSFAGSTEMMEDTESLIEQLALSLLGTTKLASGVDVRAPWPRLRVSDALWQHAGLHLQEVIHDEDLFFRTWVEAVEPQLGLERPVFITHWPAQMASLARLVPDDPDYADRFEGYALGLELCNGFGELVDAEEQRRRLHRDREARVQAGLPDYPLDERFLLALEEGIPPSGGNALGLDRALMLLLDAQSIAEVMAFPESTR